MENDVLRCLRCLHGLVGLPGWGVSATCQGVDGSREGPRVHGSVQLPCLAQKGLLGWEDDVSLCQEHLLYPVHSGMQGAAIRRMLRSGEVFQGDAEILPHEVAARVHGIAKE